MKLSLYLFSCAKGRSRVTPPPRCQERASRRWSRSRESARHRRALSLPLGAQP